MFTHMVSLETDFPNIGSRKIPINKFVTRINKKARMQAKGQKCHVCGKLCSSFCNSHSVPQFVLENVAENGKVMETFQGELPTSGNDTGKNQAGTFHIICDNCDNTLFSDYENPNAYTGVPSNDMLAQIAAKNYLQMIDKRKIEIELYALLEQRFDNFSSMPGGGKTVEELDLNEYQVRLDYALRSLSKKLNNSYYLGYYKILDYVVPYAMQSPIALIADLEGNLINNLYNFSEQYRIEYIHVAVFPLKSSSVVMLFVEGGTKRYRKFFRQLNKLEEYDQLAAINYMIFSYTENAFINPGSYKNLKNNAQFMKVCRKTTISESTIGIPNPLTQAMADFSFSQRLDIPNLLSNEYALNSSTEKQ